MSPPLPCRITPVEEEDLPWIASVARTAFLDPWTLEMFRDEFRKPETLTCKGSFGEVPAGYIFCARILDEWEILSLAVESAFRRLGTARVLLDETVRQARNSSCRRILLEVNEGNAPAIALYEGFGFHAVGRRPGYYPEDGSDALLMELLIHP